jgi:hypothetical protein
MVRSWSSWPRSQGFGGLDSLAGHPPGPLVPRPFWPPRVWPGAPGDKTGSMRQAACLNWMSSVNMYPTGRSHTAEVVVT